MAKTDARKQINVRVDDETLEAIGDLMRMDTSAPLPPTITEVFKRAVIEARDRQRKAAEKRK